MQRVHEGHALPAWIINTQGGQASEENLHVDIEGSPQLYTEGIPRGSTKESQQIYIEQSPLVFTEENLLAHTEKSPKVYIENEMENMLEIINIKSEYSST